jgi:hypothetical protein
MMTLRSTLRLSVIVGGIWTYKVEKEHAEHIEHEKHENGGQLPETPAYDHMNRRVKPFPWGNNSLFFNPEVRPLASWYPAVDANAVAARSTRT